MILKAYVRTKEKKRKKKQKKGAKIRIDQIKVPIFATPNETGTVKQGKLETDKRSSLKCWETKETAY